MRPNGALCHDCQATICEPYVASASSKLGGAKQERRQEFFREGGARGYFCISRGSEARFLDICMVSIRKIDEPGGQPTPLTPLPPIVSS